MRQPPIIKRYSEAFKQKIIAEYEQGKMTKLAITNKYGLGGSTLNKWLVEFGKHELLGIQIKVSMKKDVDELKRVNEENKKLKLALAEMTMQNLLLQKEIQYRSTLAGQPQELKKKTKPE